MEKGTLLDFRVVPLIIINQKCLFLGNFNNAFLHFSPNFWLYLMIFQNFTFTRMPFLKYSKNIGEIGLNFA